MTGFEVASAPPSMAAGLVTCRSLEYWLLWITVTVPGPVFQDAPVAVARTPTVAGLLRVTTAAACVAYPSDLEVVTSVPAATVNCAGQVDVEHVNTTEPEAKVAETKTVLAVPLSASVTVASMCCVLSSPLPWPLDSFVVATSFWGGTESFTDAVSA